MSTVVLRCPQCGTPQDGAGECEACHEATVRYYCVNHTPGRWLVGPQCHECGATLLRDPLPDIPRAAPPPPVAPPARRTGRPSPPRPRAAPVRPPTPPPVAMPPAPRRPADRDDDRDDEPVDDDESRRPAVWDVTESVRPTRRVDRVPEDERRASLPDGFPDLPPILRTPRPGEPVPRVVRIGASSLAGCLVRLVIVVLVLVALALGAGFLWVAGG